MRLRAATFLIPLALACSSKPPETPATVFDAGFAGADVQRPDVPDTGVAPEDTGVEPEDTGVEPEDTGVEPEDTGVEPEDTGVEPEDTGVEPEDTGVEPEDTGVEPEDTGVEPADTGVGPSDTGVLPDTGRRDTGVDAGRDAGRDTGVDAGRDTGVDAGRDAGVDAGRDTGVVTGAMLIEDGTTDDFVCPSGTRVATGTVAEQGTQCLGIDGASCPEMSFLPGPGSPECASPAYNPFAGPGACVAAFFSCFNPAGACTRATAGNAFTWENGARQVVSLDGMGRLIEARFIPAGTTNACIVAVPDPGGSGDIIYTRQ